MRSLFTLVPALVLVAGCKQIDDARRHEVAEISQKHAIDMADLVEARAELERSTKLPQRLDFGAAGSIVVLETALRGAPEREELYVRFMWENSTRTGIDGAKVVLTLRDPSVPSEWTEELRIGVPMLRLGPESTYTTHISMPTRGIHLHPGWSYEIRAQTNDVLARERR